MLLDGHASPQALPNDYPHEFERSVVLRDGRTVLIRPVVPTDAPALRHAIDTADSETLYHRFFNSSITLDEHQIHRLTDLDYRRRFALVAFAPDGIGVAIARYEPYTEGVVEMAVAVTPSWRRIGLASTLFAMLEEAARARGVARLHAYYLAENRAAEHLMATRGFTGPHIEDGVAEVSKPLT
jgi:GNAT superfamily N-acetyltransferase